MNRNYYKTFIRVAPDSTAWAASIPPARGGKPTLAAIEHALIAEQPYHYTQEEILFEAHVRHKGLAASARGSRRKALWDEFWVAPHACMRASALPKKYGWGLHFDEAGKVALVAVESEAYARFAADTSLQQLVAMRSRRG